MKDHQSTSPSRVASRSPPVVKSREQQAGALQEFTRVLGWLLGQRWLRQQADLGDVAEASPAVRTRHTTALGKRDGESG